MTTQTEVPMAALRRRRRRWYVLSATATVAVAATLLRAGPTTSQTTRPSTAASTAPAADTTTVHRGTLALAFDADAVFEPIDPFEVRFALRQYHDELIVRRAAAPDATVAKGDVLLAVDTDRIDRQVAAAESAAQLARANVTKAEADVALGEKADALAMGQAREAVADADLGLKRWDETDGPAMVLAGGLEAEEVDDALGDAKDELDQLHQMYKSEDLTNQTAGIVLKRATQMVALYTTFDRVARAMADRATTYEPAVHRHGLAAGAAMGAQTVEQLDASQAQARVARATALTAARAAADAADRDLADLKRDRAALTVTSPIDGVVVYGAFDHKAWQPVDPKRLAPDEKVQPEQVLLTVFQPGKLKVTAACPLSKVTLLPPGSRVTVTSPAVPEASYDGTAGAAAVVVTGSKADATVDVPVTVTGVDPHLAPGYTATVAVDVPPVTDVLLVPTSSVWHGKAWVHGADGQDEPRLVRVGRTDGQQVEVRSGLSDGDVVLTKAKKPGAAG